MEAMMGYDNTLSLDRDLNAGFAAGSISASKEVETKSTTVVELVNKKTSTTAGADEEKTAKEQAEVTNERIKESLESLNQFIPLVNTNLVFEFDDLNDPPIIKVIDRESKELIREIPSRDLDKVAKAFSDMVDTLNKSGALFNTEI
jgi:flagellar protein FlaG